MTDQPKVSLRKKYQLMLTLWRWHHSSCFTLFVSPETAGEGLSIRNGVIHVAEKGCLVNARFVGGPLLAKVMVSGTDFLDLGGGVSDD